MLIKLHCIKPDHQEEKRVYEFCTETHRVKFKGKFLSFQEFKNDARLNYHESVMAFASRDKAFREANLKQFDQLSVATPYSKESPLIGKSKVISKLSIQLGLACNYRCQYCLQAQDRAEAIKVPTENEVEAFLTKLSDAGIQLVPDALVDIWGGEPLVYWKTVKALVPRLRQRFGDRLRISLFTNGVLLTDDMADFLVRYRVQVHISHDGPGFKLRDKKDPFSDPEIKKRWMNLYEKSKAVGIPMSFFAVIHQGNCDLFVLRDYFAKHFSPEVHLDFGGAASETENLPEASIIDSEQADVLRWSMLRAVVEEPGRWRGLERRVFNLMGRLIHQVSPASIRYHCNAVDEGVLCVDIHGNVLSCQNRSASTHRIGELATYEEIHNPHFIHWKYRPDCSDCLVLGACKGGCPDLSDQALARCCVNDWAFHFGIFTTAWFLLTGTIIKQVNPVPAFLSERRKFFQIKPKVSEDEL